MATIRFRRALIENMTEFLRVGAISAETVEFSRVQRNDSPPGSNKFRMVYENAAGRISWRSNMHGLKYGSCRFWQLTDLPPGSNMLRAEIQRALRCAPRQLRRLARLANSPGFKSFRCPRWRIKFSLERFSDLSHICLRAQPLKNSAGRVPQAADGTCNKIS